jgi:hypothetical protein
MIITRINVFKRHRSIDLGASEYDVSLSLSVSGSVGG